MDQSNRRAAKEITSARVKRGMPSHLIVIGKFGGLTTFCRMTGFAVSTVHNWLRSGLVPAKWIEPGLSYQRHIIARGAANGITVDPADFIETAK